MNRAGYRLLAGELRRQRPAMRRIAFWSVVEALPTLLSGVAVAAAMDRFLAGNVGGGVGFLGLLVVAAGTGAVATRQLFPWLAAVVEPVRDAFVTSVAEGAVVAAAASASGDGRPDSAGVARLTEQVQVVRNTLFALLRSVRQTAFAFVAALTGLALLAPAVAVAGAVIVAATLTLAALLLPGLAARHRAVLLAGEEVARRAGATFGGLRDAIACGGEDRAVGEVSEAVDDEVALTRALARVATVRGLIILIGGQLPLVCLLAAAPWLLRNRYLTLGQVVGAATYLTTGLEPALRGVVDALWGWGLDLVVHIGRLGEGFAEPPAPAPAPDGDRAPVAGGYDLAVDGLTFSYGPHASPVVHDLDLSVPEGDHLAVIGSSGIGKSTLANLLAGLLTPQHGRVRLGGVDVSRLRPADLCRQIGLIPQEAYVFAGTLRENLTYLAPAATDAEIAAAADAIGLQPLIERLGGLDARIGVGGGGAAGLAAGEKQLVALVRIYLSPARIVILDEATSSLDPRAEARAEEAFARRPGSLVVIAHRISSARRAARILLLDGDSAYQGSHDELLASSSLYADLVGHWDGAARSPVPAAAALD